jgi:preprotein translocase subunit SecG
MGFFFYLVYGLFMFVGLILVMLVLIQKGRGGGLASAFGGGGGNTAFGSKTGDVLTWATSVVFGVFLVLAIGLNMLANHSTSRALAAPPVGGQSVPAGAPATAAPAPAEQGPGGPTAPTKGGETSLPQVPPGANEPGLPPKEATTKP